MSSIKVYSVDWVAPEPHVFDGVRQNPHLDANPICHCTVESFPCLYSSPVIVNFSSRYSNEDKLDERSEIFSTHWSVELGNLGGEEEKNYCKILIGKPQGKP
jgi:hypothetical protein